MKKFEYREPEFKVIVTAKEDIITASTSGILGNITGYWDTGSSGAGDGDITFGV